MLMFWEVMLCRLMVVGVPMEGNNTIFRVKQSEKDWTTLQWTGCTEILRNLGNLHYLTYQLTRCNIPENPHLRNLCCMKRLLATGSSHFKPVSMFNMRSMQTNLAVTNSSTRSLSDPVSITCIITESWLWTRVYLDAVNSKWNRARADDVTWMVTLNTCLFQTNALSKDPECDSGANSSVNNAVNVITPSAHMLMSIVHCLYLINRHCFKCRHYKDGKIITNWRQSGVWKAEGESYLN